ncbi:MAG: queuosine salvage family protein [Alphaproteobacteria bacterium]|nr:queuosine salvage family protein [Alphaproteobacteria bacterium]
MTAASALHFTDDIRAAAAHVAANARHVRLNQESIVPFTRSLLHTRRARMTALDMQTLCGGTTAEEKTAYALALDAINFGSGYFELARQSGVALEYADLARALRHAFDAKGFSDPARWAEITPQDCHALFVIPAGAHPQLDDLMTLFARHLQEAGAKIVSDYGGRALNLLEAADRSAERLAAMVGAWDGFRDVAEYHGSAVPVFKRAQIFAADVWLALGGAGAADFQDMHRLTIFADNMVPHVLRHGGVLSYDPALAARIDAGQEIPAGSAEEIELRALAIHACEIIRDAAQAAGDRALTAVNLDHILWNRGYEVDLIDLPRHRTCTVWY